MTLQRKVSGVVIFLVNMSLIIACAGVFGEYMSAAPRSLYDRVAAICLFLLCVAGVTYAADALWNRVDGKQVPSPSRCPTCGRRGGEG